MPKVTLSQQLASLVNPAPALQDPEDDINPETQAQVIDHTEEFDFEVESGFPVFSKLRSKNAILLEDLDTRYAGQTVSRRRLQEQEVDVDIEVVGLGEDPTDEDLASFKENLPTADEEEESEEEESSDEEEEDSSNEEGDEDELSSSASPINSSKRSKGEAKDEAVMIQNFSKVDIGSEIEKGMATKAQLSIWDSLLECRIKLQKNMHTGNQLPPFDCWPEFNRKGDKDFKYSCKEGIKSIKLLLDKLVHLQTLLLQGNLETRNILNDKELSKKSSQSDEEIPSDTDEDNTIETEEQRQNQKRKLKLDEYPSFLSKRHKSFESYRNTVIQKWQDKTRLATGKINSKSFAAFEQSALKQIDQILSDKERLIKRTQLQRSAYRILGKEEKSEENLEIKSEQEAEPTPLRGDPLKSYDTEIFDDNDFYHQQLREFIERRTADVSDPIALGRQWLEIQKLRSKIKKKVDTKASKGRKLRFDPHPKLINLMAPVNKCTLSEEAKNDLFSSLFGKKQVHS